MLTYHGFTFPHTRVDSIAFAPKYSEDGADYLYTTTTLSVSSVLSAQVIELEAGETLAAAGRRIRHLLEVPRQSLSYDLGDGVLVTCGPGEDVANGPFPEVLSVTPIGASLHVKFRVRCHRVECDGRGDPPAYLSNRWDESVSIDYRGRTTYTRSGKVVTRSDLSRDPDALRGVATPPLAAGFVREDFSYTVQSDGLALRYSFRDVQTPTMPPSPAVRASGDCQVTALNAATLMAEVSVKLVGDDKADKGALLLTAISVAMERLERCGPQLNKGQIAILTGGIRESLYEPEVEVTLRSKLVGQLLALQTSSPAGSSTGEQIGGAVLAGFFGLSGVAVAVAAAAFDRADAKPGDEPKKGVAIVPKGVDLFGVGPPPKYSGPGTRAPDPGLRGTAGLHLIAAQLGDPCARQTVAELRQGPNAPYGPAGEPTGTAVTSAPPAVPAVPPTTSSVSGTRRAAPPRDDSPGEATLTSAGVGFPAGFAPAQVTVVDSIPDTVEKPNFLKGGAYLYYTLKIVWDIDHNRTALAEQKVGGVVRHIKLGADDIRMRVLWDCARVGEPPVIPQAGRVTNANLVPYRDYWEGEIDLAEDGVNPLYRSWGYLDFAVTDPALAKFGSAVPPWLAELMGMPPVATFDGGPLLLDPTAATAPDGKENLKKWRDNRGPQ